MHVTAMCGFIVCPCNMINIFIITNTMHTIEVDKITLFETTLKQRIISYMFRSSLDHHQGGL